MTKLISYRGYRYPPEVISYAVWLYYRFTLSLRNIEDLLSERGVRVSYESIRLWSRYTRGDCESVQDAWAIRGVWMKS